MQRLRAGWRPAGVAAATLAVAPTLIGSPDATAQDSDAKVPTLVLRRAPTVAAVAPDPGSAAAAQIEAAEDLRTLLDLQARGAEPELVDARLAALGFVAAVAGGSRQWLRPGGGDGFRDCTGCPELVVVPPGEVTMRIEGGAGKAREVTVAIPQAFAAGRFEVTRAEFAAFVEATGHAVSPGCYARAPDWQLRPELDWRNPGFAQDDDHPVACVSADDATAYTEWLSQRTGQSYRLPTDPEWHHLAAGDAPPADPAALCASGNGADESALDVHAGWIGAPCRDGHVHTAPVGRFDASPWGLSDLDGNVWEWVDTCPPSSGDAPFPPRICAAGDARILRGGSFADRPDLRTLDARLVSPPTVRDQVAGFRIVRDLQQ